MTIKKTTKNKKEAKFVSHHGGKIFMFNVVGLSLQTPSEFAALTLKL